MTLFIYNQQSYCSARPSTAQQLAEMNRTGPDSRKEINDFGTQSDWKTLHSHHSSATRNNNRAASCHLACIVSNQHHHHLLTASAPPDTKDDLSDSTLCSYLHGPDCQESSQSELDVVLLLQNHFHQHRRPGEYIRQQKRVQSGQIYTTPVPNPQRPSW